MKELILLPLLFLSFAQAETIQCKVIKVIDGDTITCLTSLKEQINVRLFQIDAPEIGQSCGQIARRALYDMIFDKEVFIKKHGTDQNKRTLGTITARNFTAFQECENAMSENTRKADQKMTWECNLPIYDINLEMIRQGYAWYNPFTKNNPKYQQVQEEAKQAKRNLWAAYNAIPPWEWKQERIKLKNQKLDYKPKLISQKHISFPESAHDIGLKRGTVLVELKIKKNGRTTDLIVINSTHPSFTKQAVKFLLRSRYSPAIAKDEFVEAVIMQRIIFELDDDSDNSL